MVSPPLCSGGSALRSTGHQAVQAGCSGPGYELHRLPNRDPGPGRDAGGAHPVLQAGWIPASC